MYILNRPDGDKNGLELSSHVPRWQLADEGAYSLDEIGKEVVMKKGGWEDKTSSTAPPTVSFCWATLSTSVTSNSALCWKRRHLLERNNSTEVDCPLAYLEIEVTNSSVVSRSVDDHFPNKEPGTRS